MKEKILLLRNNFILRNSYTKSILQNLISGAVYEMEEDQVELIRLLDGTRTLSDIKKMYSEESLDMLDVFIENLQSLNAIQISDNIQNRFFVDERVPDKRLESVHLEASGKCNMRCKHCYQGDLVTNEDELSHKEIVSLLDQMVKMQINNIGISGGEPLMMKNLLSLFEEIEKRSIRISALFTNGLLINDNFIKQVVTLTSKFPIFVSLDSMPGIPFNFRSIPKSKSDLILSRIISNIKKLVKSGVSVTINTVVNTENINHLDEMYGLIKSLGIKSWRLGFPKQTELFKKHASNFNVEWEIIAKNCFSILKNHFAYNKPFDLQIEYLYRETLFSQGLHDLKGEDYVCDYEGRRGECCIKPNGDVVSCAYCNNIPIGNIKRDSLYSIWYSPKMQGIKEIRIDSVNECKGCNLASICGTGCRANAYFLHGDFYNAKDDYACKAVKFFSEKVYPLLLQYGYKS